MSKSANIQSLIGQSGVTPETVNMFNTADYGQMIQNGITANLDDVTAEETVIVSVLIDDSSSIESAGNTDLVRNGHNMIIKALQESKQRDGVMFYSATLNSGVINGLNLLDMAQPLDNNWRPYGGTPLYDRMKQTLATVLATVGHFESNNQPCRTITVVVTDGADIGSREADGNDIGRIVKDMEKAEGMHIIAAVGIDDGGTDFRAIFHEMGIKDNWILTPANNESDIRRAFNVLSQRVSQASQGSQNFSNAVTGGFGI